MRLRWTARAEADLARLWLFAAEHDIDRADSIIAEIKRRALLLETFPQFGHTARGEKDRELSLTDIRYVIRYRVDEAETIIVRVHHAREDRERQ